MIVRVLHHWEAGYGWSFDSPDIPGLIGGPAPGEDRFRAAEDAVRFALEFEREEANARSDRDVTIEHFVPATLVTGAPA